MTTLSQALKAIQQLRPVDNRIRIIDVRVHGTDPANWPEFGPGPPVIILNGRRGQTDHDTSQR